VYPAAFDYYRPKTLAEATKLLGQHREAKVLAGGHSLLPVMKLRLAAPPAVIDIGGLADLRGVHASGAALRIGALTTYAAILDDQSVRRSCPLLAEAVANIGDIQVRNRGTIGGSLAHADPAADLPGVMLTLEATITATGPGGGRDIPAERFFTDLFTTALQAGELLTAVAVPTYGAGTGGAYVKHRHPASSYAVVGVSALVAVRDGKVSKASVTVGGATAVPTRLTGVEQALTGQTPDEGTLLRAVKEVEGAIRDPLGDLYASPEYRVHLARVLAKRALETAAERAREKEAPRAR
jgi:aerobic carbon-monoxide dehydrogenase medium subunit